MTETRTERIRSDIENLAGFSAVEGMGCTRYSYTREFAQARDYIVKEMKKAGLSVREDAAGTVVGRMEGRDPSAPVIMTGSHFDTVKTGGRFDGIAGVVAALEAARVLNEEGFRPRQAIEFVAMPEEEGARFGGGLFASRAMCGRLYENELESYRDEQGVSMAQAMRDYGLEPDKIEQARRSAGEIGLFLELHIEQGPVLENEAKDIGVVEAIVGLKCLEVLVSGRSDHAGSTPMDMRADTVLASAKAMVAGTEKALALGEGTVVTFGRVETRPGAFNIVANETGFCIDCRSKSMACVDSVIDSIRASLEQSCGENPGLSFRMEEKLEAQPVLMKPEMQDMLEELAAEAGFSSRRILSGAGHDAMIMGSICDVAMIFVPSKGGRSHVPEEWTDYEQLRRGAELLCRSLRRLSE